MKNAEVVRDWYRRSYSGRRAHRQDELNPEVWLQRQADEFALRRAIYRTGLEPTTATTLDIGCGGGVSLLQVASLGFALDNLVGIDILEERAALARARLPGARIVCGDARALPWSEPSFDLVTALMTLVPIVDRQVRADIASEMLRVTKPGGYLIVADWLYNRPGSREYRALTLNDIRRMFRVGEATVLLARYPGALIPPIGRFLSARSLPALYFLLQQLFPPAVGQMTVVLRRVAGIAAPQGAWEGG